MDKLLWYIFVRSKDSTFFVLDGLLSRWSTAGMSRFARRRWIGGRRWNITAPNIAAVASDPFGEGRRTPPNGVDRDYSRSFGVARQCLNGLGCARTCCLTFIPSRFPSSVSFFPRRGTRRIHTVCNECVDVLLKCARLRRRQRVRHKCESFRSFFPGNTDRKVAARIESRCATFRAFPTFHSSVSMSENESKFE